MEGDTVQLAQIILKELVAEYQEDRSQITFSRILKRADNLLLHAIHKHVRRRGITRVDLRDLYHTAIVGLGRAALTSPKDEHPEKFTARIIAYVRLEIDKNYCRGSSRGSRTLFDDTVEVETVLKVKEEFVEYDENLEFSFLMELFKEAVEEDVVTNQELDLFLRRYMFNEGFQKIGEELNIKQDGARKRIISVRKRLFDWMELKGTIL